MLEIWIKSILPKISEVKYFWWWQLERRDLRFLQP
jgi:hypothetical protein